MFVDEATIKIKAGDGGAGGLSFRREKYIRFGGPDGGNGGRGGDVVLLADRNIHTLLDFQFQPLWRAQSGGSGNKRNKDGANGEDLIIRLPVGTSVYDESGNLLTDLALDEQRCVVAKGGRGGKGNAFFKSSTHQTPRFSQPGENGEESTITLSLKVVADVGLIGFPNAGKSTLISKVSSAKPKVADYPFTTLSPQLGTVRTEDASSLVLADIPGLIPDAHTGKGLGIDFLKHIERTSVLAHLIDPLSPDEQGQIINPRESWECIRKELKSYSDTLARKPELIVISKADLIPLAQQREEIIEQFDDLEQPPLFISSLTGEGIKDFLRLVTKMVIKT